MVDLKNIAGTLKIPQAEVEAKYKVFREGYLEGLTNIADADMEKIETNILSVFGQKLRYDVLSARASGAVTVKMYVMGITNIRDNINYRRSEIIKNYKLAPAQMLFTGRVNEYHVTVNGVTKVSVDPETKARTETIVDAVPPNAELYENDVYIAPKDHEKEKRGKANWFYGKEYPLHDFSRDIFGVAELDEDVRYFRLTIRNDNAINNLPEIGKSYNVKVLDVTKDDELLEYTFRDSPTQTKWEEIEWEIYEDTPQLVGIMEGSIIWDHRENLENLRHIAEREDKIKDDNKKKQSCGEKPDYSGINYNSCLFVEVNVMEIYIEPESSEQTSRIVVSSDYYGENFDIDEGIITGWLADKVNIDFDIYSKVVLCCYPRLGKAKENQTQRPLQIDVYGALAYDEYKIMFKPEKISEI